MMGWSKFVMLGLLGLAGCKDNSPHQNPRPCEGSACITDQGVDYGRGHRYWDGGQDKGVIADQGPEALVMADVTVPDMEPPDQGNAFISLACAPTAPEPRPPYSLERAVLHAELPMGGPPSVLVPINLDGDEAGSIEFVLIRGGRVTVVGQDGRTWWRSTEMTIRRIAGVADLDGDGRLEVVAVGLRTVLVFDGLTGRGLWQLDDHPFPDAPDVTLAGLDRALLVDLNGDGRLSLYATDAGCSRDGDGRGVFVHFERGPDGLLGTIDGVIDTPRSNGRCTHWHSIGDVHPAPGQELIMTDAVGLHVFSSAGNRLACGPNLGGPSSGKYPHQVARLADDELASIVVFWGGSVAVLAVAADEENRCPDTDHSLKSRWQVDFELVSAEGSALLDANDDGILDVWTSAWQADEWRLVVLSGLDGSLLFQHADARLLAVTKTDPPQVLITRGSPRRRTRFTPVELHQFQGGQLSLLTALDGQYALQSPRRLGTQPDRTDELSSPLIVDGAFILLAEANLDGVGQGSADRIVRLSPNGDSLIQRLHGAPGPIRRVGDQLGVALANGDLALFDQEMLLRNPGIEQGRPAASAPAGRVTIRATESAVGPAPIALSGSGILRGLDLVTNTIRWSKTLGRDSDSPTSAHSTLLVINGGRSDHVVAMDSSGVNARWSAFDVRDGHLVWTHALPADQVALRGAVIAMDHGTPLMVVRTDLLRDPHNPPAFECDRVRLPQRWAEPDAACPNRPVIVRLLSGLDPQTGQCLWQTIIRAHNSCTGPGNQTISVADSDGDGIDELYMTESDAIRRIDPRSGLLQTVGPIEPGADGRPRGGGWIHATGANSELTRVGGNGPLDVVTQDLDLVWRAESPELRPQAWLIRDGLVIDDTIWLSPTVGLPMHRYQIADGTITNTFALVGGALLLDPPLERTADLRSAQLIPGLLGDDDGVLLTTDEGIVYALTRDAELAWSRSLNAQLGSPVVADIDGDETLNLVVPVADGMVQVYGPRGPDAIGAVWDLACPARATCDPATAIDTTMSTTTLCAEFIPQQDAEGYEARVVTDAGVAVTDWQTIEGPEPVTQLDDLPLVPSAVYCVEVRSWQAQQGRRDYSEPTRSGCVLVVDDAPPTISLIADAECFTVGGQAVLLTLDGRDDDLLAGWSLVMMNEAQEIVRSLGSGPLAQPRFTEVRGWNGLLQNKDPTPPGLYTAVGAVVDRRGNLVTARVELPTCPPN